MSLVATRERRTNAGARMRELLQQEIELEEMFQEVANDEDFVVMNDDEDLVDSDFDQSSGQEENDNEDAEIQIILEEKREKKAAAKKVNMITFGPVLRKRKRPEDSLASSYGGITSMPGASEYMIKKPEKKKKTAAPIVPVLNGIRSSSRRHTVESKKILQQKLKEYERRKAQLPKREKVFVQPKTQEELLAEAKKTEEQNLASLRAFELREAEKIQSARPFKEKRIEGPYIREISYVEGDRKKKLILEIPSGQDGKGASRESKNARLRNDGEGLGDSNADKRQARKLIIFAEFPKNESAKFFEAWRKKPLKVKKVLCPFTGLTAKYKDPKTGIPYATVEAYQRLQQILNHSYVWSPVLNAYVNAANQRPAEGVPPGFEVASMDRHKRDKKSKEEKALQEKERKSSKEKDKSYTGRERRASFKGS